MIFRSVADVEPPPERRQRPLDNPRLLIVAAFLLIAVLAGLFWLSDRSSQIALPLLTDVLLVPLLAVDLALLATLLFVLARNLLKLWVEQRQARPFGRFRAKLVAALLLMTIMPAILVLISGSEIIRSSANSWFSEPVGDAVGAAQSIAARFYQERTDAMALRAEKLSRVLPQAALTAQDVGALTPLLIGELATMSDGMVEVYAVNVDPVATTPRVDLVVAQEAESLPRGHVRASADRLAARAVASGRTEKGEDPLDGGGGLIRAASPIVAADGQAVGAVVVSQFLSGELREQARLATASYERYQSFVVLEAPLRGFYLSIFLTITLLILISATWLGLYPQAGLHLADLIRR